MVDFWLDILPTILKYLKMIIIHELGIRSLSTNLQKANENVIADSTSSRMSVLRRVWKHDLLHFDGTTKTDRYV